MKKEEQAEFDKMENSNKELCSKTRAASEGNNKKSVKLWEKTISTLEGNCRRAQEMETQKRKVFVNSVCVAISKDVQSTVSLDTKKIMKIMHDHNKLSTATAAN